MDCLCDQRNSLTFAAIVYGQQNLFVINNSCLLFAGNSWNCLW